MENSQNKLIRKHQKKQSHFFVKLHFPKSDIFIVEFFWQTYFLSPLQLVEKCHLLENLIKLSNYIVKNLCGTNGQSFVAIFSLLKTCLSNSHRLEQSRSLCQMMRRLFYSCHGLYNSG